MLESSQSIAREGLAPSAHAQELVLESVRALDGASASATDRILEFVEDLDRAMSFMTRWTLGPVLGLEPGQRMDRWGITRALSERAEREADFRREFLRHPRYVSALAVHEGLGIKPIYFLWQVKVVTLLEETPGLHWLILPACHRGCAALDGDVLGSAPSSCQACGKPLGGAGAGSWRMSLSGTPVDRAHDVDDFIIRSVQADAAARARLLADPTPVFTQTAQELFGVGPREAFWIREVKVAEDTDTVLYFVLLARHETPG